VPRAVGQLPGCEAPQPQPRGRPHRRVPLPPAAAPCRCPLPLPPAAATCRCHLPRVPMAAFIKASAHLWAAVFCTTF
jgi:hypothetical protein